MLMYEILDLVVLNDIHFALNLPQELSKNKNIIKFI